MDMPKMVFMEKDISVNLKMKFNKMRDWVRINLEMMVYLDKEKQKRRFIVEEIFDYIAENQNFEIDDLVKYLEDKKFQVSKETIKRFLDQLVDEKLLKNGSDTYRVND